MVTEVSIAGRRIGRGYPCYVIAEAGVNHNGDIGMAKKLVDGAIDAGADAVKFQTFNADRLVTREAPKANYQLQTTDVEESHFEMIRNLELTPDMHVELLAYCADRPIEFLSSPFDEISADYLEELGVSAFKIPSGEITNLPYLAHIAGKGKPIILSTGMSRLGEVVAATDTIRNESNDQIFVLHCVSNYPADPADVNLRAMATMAGALGLPVGYSDHTEGIEVPVAAVAMGACMIEKHFTLDRTLPGPDHPASLEPAELNELVRSIRSVESALGSGRKEPAPSEANTAAVARKSIVALADIPRGTVISAGMVGPRRPGTGLPPSMIEQVVGRTTRSDVPAGTVLSLEMFV